MEPREYITHKAMIECEQGSAPGFFTPTYNQTVKINGCKVSTATDKVPLTNIPNFVVCKKTQKPCVPVPTDWTDTYQVKVKGQQTLIGKSCIDCSLGGKIKFQTSGQVPLSPEEEEQVNNMREDVKKAYDKEQEEKNKPWWKKAGEFIVDCVPVVGPIVSMAKNISEGNWGMAAMDLGFLALDVVGVVGAPFTGGASLAGTTALKIGARQAIKAGAKQVAKKLSKEALEAAAKQTAEMISKMSMRSLTKGQLCVFACFPAGTPVATALGIRNIEDIRPGDEVWAYDESTGEPVLKPVVQVGTRDANVLVNIEIGGEVVQATPEHPVYVDGAWKEAGLLEPGDSVSLLSGEIAKVDAVTYTGAHAPVETGGDEAPPLPHVMPGASLETTHPAAYAGPGEERPEEEEVTKVYNFEVEGLHNYFVGWLKLLVHNGVCLFKLAREGVEYAQNILKGIRFNHLMEKRLLDGVHEVFTKGMKTRLDTLIPGKKIISRKASQLAELTTDTAKKYIDEIPKKYKKGTPVQNPKRAGADKLEGKYVLQVPKQEKPIPKEILDHAKSKKVKIEEVSDITMDMLKWW